MRTRPGSSVDPRSSSARPPWRARWHAEGDPGSGVAAGIVETVAFLACYFALRSRLALGGSRAEDDTGLA